MNDAISRRAVVDRLETLRRNYTLKAGYREAMTDAIGEVRSAPALNVAPVVHAKWVGGKYYNDVYGYEKTCTACQREYVVGFDYLFCPYCGARMDGEAE